MGVVQTVLPASVSLLSFLALVLLLSLPCGGILHRGAPARQEGDLRVTVHTSNTNVNVRA